MLRIIKYIKGPWRMAEEPKQTTMKKYKLLKDLPDSKIGDEYIWVDKQGAYHKNGDITESYLLKENVENSPLWFGEVKEKTWQIIHYSYRTSVGEIVATRVEAKDVYFGMEGYSIHSVKRLSDGVIFSVGDAFYGSCDTKKYTIQSFLISNDEMLVNTGSFNIIPFTLERLCLCVELPSTEHPTEAELKSEVAAQKDINKILSDKYMGALKELGKSKDRIGELEKINTILRENNKHLHFEVGRLFYERRKNI